ncbi:antibiotic biosynthesis monooxygenase [Lottiidibacillus patelloidae]|uniref:Antibiotic biosynthesis monooxygenase n=1 Tax=Lottiidibacillus patelloidae TaxID=2670334 RepID=A0A263BWY4_9BACI|nr:putative quinol monooxygenase [Lottiidibacillus patelloidae]OZM58072.1 antibiotic biosynthesis monooxygenase [Lottiidibacillus patelloidae]
MNNYSLFGKITAKDGEQETLLTILLEAAEAMKSVEDCEIYAVNTSTEDSNSIFVYEVWKDEQAHLASLHLEVTQTLIKKAKPIIAGMERIVTLQAKGGKGISSSI